MKAEAERVRTLLMDTVTLLCKNGLRFEKQLKVEGLIGITVDADVFLVHFNEQFSGCNEQVIPKQENDGLSHDKSVTPYSQSDQAGMTHYLQHSTTNTFQDGQEFIDCDEGETFDRKPVKEEIIIYDDVDRGIPSKDEDSYSRYSHNDASYLGSTREVTFERDLNCWSLINQCNNNVDGDANDVTDDGMFTSAYANSSASCAQQQQSLSHLDDQMQHTMDSNLVHWTDTSQFLTSDRLNKRSIVGRSQPVPRKCRSIVRGRGRTNANNNWFSECKPEPSDSPEWTPSSQYAGQARRKSMGRGGLRARVETQASDGFSYGKLTVTKYMCNICGASYKHQCNLLTHQVRVHGRQKKKTGRRPKNVNPDDDVGPV